MRRLILILFALTAGLTLHAGSLDAQLIRASKALTETDVALLPLHPKLKTLFGYEHYQQLGRQQTALRTGGRQLLNLGEGFTLFVTPHGTTANTCTVALEWYSGKTAILKTTATLTEKSPLLIKGPEVGHDWIVLALTFRP
jgi:hypothetical protein